MWSTFSSLLSTSFNNVCFLQIFLQKKCLQKYKIQNHSLSSNFRQVLKLQIFALSETRLNPKPPDLNTRCSEKPNPKRWQVRDATFLLILVSVGIKNGVKCTGKLQENYLCVDDCFRDEGMLESFIPAKFEKKLTQLAASAQHQNKN